MIPPDPVDVMKQIDIHPRQIASVVVQTSAIAGHAERLAWRATSQQIDISQHPLRPLAKSGQVPKISEAKVMLDHRSRKGCDFRDPNAFPAELLPSQVNGTDPVADAEVPQPPITFMRDHRITLSFFWLALRPESSVYGTHRSSKSGPATPGSQALASNCDA
jgi:hypothetical protein